MMVQPEIQQIADLRGKTLGASALRAGEVVFMKALLQKYGLGERDYDLVVAGPSRNRVSAMTSRQIGHFFFEPRDYDVINQATHEHKEEIKVGYNLQRKVVLMSIWALSPIALYLDPTLFGLFTPHADKTEFVRHVALIWLAIGVGGLLFRTVHLFFIKGVQSGLVWMTKILTDPFHDVKLYHTAPLYLLRGELIDPHHAQHGEEEEQEQLDEELEEQLRGA